MDDRRNADSAFIHSINNISLKIISLLKQNLPNDNPFLKELDIVRNKLFKLIVQNSNVEQRAKILLEFSNFLNLVEKFKQHSSNAFLKIQPDLSAALDYFNGVLKNDEELRNAYFGLRLDHSTSVLSLASRPIRNAILPSLTYGTKVIQPAREELIRIINENQSELDFRRTQVPVIIGDTQPLIDTITATYPPNSNSNQNPEEVLHLVFFIGNGELSETTIAAMADYAKELAERSKRPVQLTAFNYPGVADSQGNPTHLQHLVKAGEGVVKNLIDKGANPENMILYGHSLGGIIATFAARNLHNEGNKVNLMNGRSLAETTKVMAISNNFFGETLLTNWRGDAVTAFNQIPSEYKDYFLVKVKKNETGQKKTMVDDVIRHGASLYVGMKQQEKESPEPQHPAKGFEPDLTKDEKKQLRNQRKLMASDHYVGIYNEGLAAETDPKERKKSQQAWSNMHNVSLNYLVDRSGESAREKLIKFCVERYQAAMEKKQEAKASLK